MKEYFFIRQEKKINSLNIKIEVVFIEMKAFTIQTSPKSQTIEFLHKKVKPKLKYIFKKR